MEFYKYSQSNKIYPKVLLRKCLRSENYNHTLDYKLNLSYWQSLSFWQPKCRSNAHRKLLSHVTIRYITNRRKKHYRIIRNHTDPASERRVRVGMQDRRRLHRTAPTLHRSHLQAQTSIPNGPLRIRWASSFTDSRSFRDSVRGRGRVPVRANLGQLLRFQYKTSHRPIQQSDCV